MKVKPEEKYNYLASKSIAYHLGWESCLGGEDALTSRRELRTSKQREEFDQGYSDCYANGESDPESYDDDSGYDQYKEERAGLI